MKYIHVFPPYGPHGVRSNELLAHLSRFRGDDGKGSGDDGNWYPSTTWIPAYAGMTGEGRNQQPLIAHLVGQKKARYNTGF